MSEEEENGACEKVRRSARECEIVRVRVRVRVKKFEEENEA